MGPLRSGLTGLVCAVVLVLPGAPARGAAAPGASMLAAAIPATSAAAPDGIPDGEYARRAWEFAGRRWLAEHAGVTWDDGRREWRLEADWPAAPAEVGPRAYYIEYATRPAVELARVRRDAGLIDELARFHLTYLARFVTLGELRGRASLMVSARLLDGQGPDTARTLPWIERRWWSGLARECVLCNAQFFHPVARLIRLIAELPPAQRTASMQVFVRRYVPLVVREHLVRIVFETRPIGTGFDDARLIDGWRETAREGPRAARGSRSLRDVDLWLIAAAAEMVGAHAADPVAVPLDGDEPARLRELVRVGVAALATKRTVYRDVRDFAGRSVESASYFNGDADDHPDMAYAAHQGAAPPSARQRAPSRGASWDVSHFYRMPVLLRALLDNRAATGVPFPTEHDLALLINQYTYRVFNGLTERPLFVNFFDGSDGWYRVGYHGPGFGYPPSVHCDTRDERRPCLTAGGVFGWGLLAAYHPDLHLVHDAVIRLATSVDPDAVRFRERYYRFNDEAFAWTDPDGRPRYPMLLFVLLGDGADRRPARAR